jgi:hypothetical protein
MKTLIIALLLATASLQAAPYGVNIPLPTETVGGWQPNGHYTIRYVSAFGGQWDLAWTSRRADNHNGTFTDVFSGTVSDTSINGTFTQANFTWLSDSWYLENGSHGWIPCKSFILMIRNGQVSGKATFTPPSAPDAPDSWALHWHVSGTVTGAFDVGLGLHGNPAPTWTVAYPGGGGTWILSIPTTGEIVTGDGGDCSRMKLSVWDIFYSSTGQNQWHVWSTFTLADTNQGCCSLPPPQNCNGVYFVHIGPSPHTPSK